MKRFMLAGVLAACTTTPAPDPATLLPRLDVHAGETQLMVGVAFEDDRHVADVDVTFRGATSHLGHPSDHAYAVNVVLDLDHPVQDHEPIVVTVDGIAMTLDPPPPFDGLSVPQFISRSGSATISWTTASADELVWYTGSACVRGGGMLAPNATSVSFTSADWLPPDAGPGGGTCTTVLSLVRDRMAGVDPAFQGGSVEIDQQADVVFASTP